MTMGIGMIEWFDDLTLGMRFKSGNKLVTREDIIGVKFTHESRHGLPASKVAAEPL